MKIDPATRLPIPFSSRAHDDGTADLGGCVLCGRPTPGARYFVEIAHGGRIVKPGTVDKSDAGYMDHYPIGAECRKKLPAEYVVDERGAR